jgi:hypothetical protein
MSLVCTNFNKQYKQLQRFRNRYLKMIRLVINNADKMTFEQILTYHELEWKINQLDKNIQEFSAELQGLNKKDQIDESDYKMIKTVKDLLPFMISYYNHIPNIKNQNDD